MAEIYALKRFHIYLYFKIVMDYNSFRLTLAKKDLNPRISRWALFLQTYDYTIEYRSGKKMSHDDALSRFQNILVQEENRFEQNLAVTQDLDDQIVKIRAELEVREYPHYELRNGLVYRKENDKILFYVPVRMENNILIACHDNFGHVGEDCRIH